MNVKSTENQIIRVCDRSTLALFYESFGLFDSNQPWIRSFFSFLLTSHIYYWDICKIAAMLAGCHIFHDYVYPFGILQTWEGKVHNYTVLCFKSKSKILYFDFLECTYKQGKPLILSDFWVSSCNLIWWKNKWSLSNYQKFF